jgi:hypothetical protein
MSGRVRLVGDAKVRNGVLHIAAPQRGSLLKPQKLLERCQALKKPKELLKRKD